MITLTGILPDPLGKPLPNTSIRFTALASEGGVLQGTDAVHITDKLGHYNFTVCYGHYRLEILQNKEFHESGLVLVDEHLPNPCSLQELVLYAAPYTPPLFSPNKPNWTELFKAVREQDEWDREAEEQVRNGNVFANEDMAIHKADKKHLTENTHTVSSGSVLQASQQLAYQDDYAQEASVTSSESTTSKATQSHSQETYTHSDGTSEASSHIKMQDSSGTLDQELSIKGNTLGINAGNATGTTTVSATGTSETYSIDKSAIHKGELTETKYVDADDLVNALISQGIKLSYSRNGFPLEAFQRLCVDSANGAVQTTQLDRQILQARDGHKVIDIDTEKRHIKFDASIEFNNTDDFIGEEGWSYDHLFEYSNDQQSWHKEYVYGDRWRKDQKIKFKENKPEEIFHVGVPEIIQLNAKDGEAGDNYYLEYEYTTEQEYPNGWHTTYSDKDDWRRWRTVRITSAGSEISDWQVEPIKGTDGPEGWIPEFQIYYGPDGTQPLYSDLDNDGSLAEINMSYWHTNLSNEDLFKYERKVWWKTQADFTKSRKDSSMIPHVMEPWVGPVKIKPIAGEDYGNQNAQLFLYKRAQTKPSDQIGVWKYTFSSDLLEPVNGNTQGWSTSVVAGDLPLWVATARAQSITDIDTHIDNWDVDKMTENGLKSAVGYLYQVTSGSVTSVHLPSHNLTFSFSTQLVTGSLNNGWLSTPPNNVGDKQKLWRTFAPVTAEAYAATETIAVNDWETATVLAQNGSHGSDGSMGVDGKPGKHGSGSFIVYCTKAQAQGYSNAQRDSQATSLASRPVQNGDMISYTDNDSNPSYSLSYLRKNGSWVSFKFKFDGDVIVHGTLAAESLKANSAIVDKIRVSSAKNSNELVISGSGFNNDGYRMWAGHADPRHAPFRLLKDGTVYANKLILGGTLPSQITAAQNTANSANSAAGTAQGGVNNLNNKVYVNQNKIQIKSAIYVQGREGWAIDQNGTAEFNKGIFRGELQVGGGTGGSKLRITKDCIEVWDNGKLRVKLGRLK